MRNLKPGDRVRVISDDALGRVTAVHPDSQVEVEFLDAGSSSRKRGRYALEALEPAGDD